MDRVITFMANKEDVPNRISNIGSEQLTVPFTVGHITYL